MKRITITTAGLIVGMRVVAIGAFVMISHCVLSCGKHGVPPDQDIITGTTNQFDTLPLADTLVAMKDVVENAASHDAPQEVLIDSSDSSGVETVAIVPSPDSHDTYDTEVALIVVPPDTSEVETHYVDANSFWLPDIVSSLPDVNIIADSEAINMETKAEIVVADVGADAKAEATVETVVPSLPTDISVGIDEIVMVETSTYLDVSTDEAGNDGGEDTAISVEVGDDTFINTETDIVAIPEEPEYIGDEVCRVIRNIWF